MQMNIYMLYIVQDKTVEQIVNKYFPILIRLLRQGTKLIDGIAEEPFDLYVQFLDQIIIFTDVVQTQNLSFIT